MKRNPDFVVGREGHPYLLRWWLLPRNRWFNAYWHRFVNHDEDRALHDHPWPSVSLVVRGGYYEITVGPDGTNERRWYGPGSVIIRSASYTHRVELAMRDGQPVPCDTLFLTGPRIREWGFHCPQGWRHWKEFVAQGNAGQIGKGCDN